MIYLTVRQKELEVMQAVVAGIIEEYKYTRQDGSEGLRLQGMRKIVHALAWMQYRKTPPEVVTEITGRPDEITCTAKLVGGERKDTAICVLDEHRIAGDPYWERMPEARLRQVAEARLYRQIYPLIFGEYAEVEGDVSQGKPQHKPQGKPQHEAKAMPVKSWVKTRIGHMTALVVTYEDDTTATVTDPETIKEILKGDGQK